jgi:Na+/H+-dicarboxylate symporter
MRSTAWLIVGIVLGVLVGVTLYSAWVFSSTGR